MTSPRAKKDEALAAQGYDTFRLGTNDETVLPNCAHCEERQLEIRRLRSRIVELDAEVATLRERLLRSEFERPPHYG
ncbi:MAG: hypothetical protein ACP5O0_08930 [Acidimicrobiales bacterium]